MTHKSVPVVLLALIFMLITSSVSAQENQLVPIHNNVYTYIKSLQQRGYFTSLNPTQLPYTRGTINNSLEKIEASELSTTELFWYESIKEAVGFNRNTQDSESAYLYGMLEGGFEINNTLSSNGLRPQVDKLFVLPNIGSNLYAGQKGFAAQLGLRHNSFYDHDRYGEPVNSRFALRAEDYYIGYNNGFFSAYMGRYHNLWAPYDEASVLLSDNASSFDRLNISVGPSWFKVSGVFAELDNLGKDGTFERGSKNRINGVKRYLALHRIDIKILDNLRIGYFDGFIYSSENSIASLRYIVPTNFFFFERNSNPVNDEFNALFGGQIWWQYQNLTFNLQAMIDDIVIKGVKLESQIEPTTFAITNSVNFSNVTDFLDVGYEAEFVAYQTYNTDQAEGRYLFLKRGIANQFTDYSYVSVFANIHAYQWVKSLTLTPRITYLAQGEQEINQPFVDRYPNGEVIDVILSGTEEKRSRISLNAFYNPVPEFWIDAGIGYNYTRDMGHVEGKDDSRLTAKFEIGFRLDLDK